MRHDDAASSRPPGGHPDPAGSRPAQPARRPGRALPLRLRVRPRFGARCNATWRPGHPQLSHWSRRAVPRAGRRSSMSGVDGKVVLITGAATACGRVLAEAFAAEGAKVVGCDTNADPGRAAAEAVESAGGAMTFIGADVGGGSAVEKVVNAAGRAFVWLVCAG